jgi:hypothetical protein
MLPPDDTRRPKDALALNRAAHEYARTVGSRALVTSGFSLLLAPVVGFAVGFAVALVPLQFQPASLLLTLGTLAVGLPGIRAGWRARREIRGIALEVATAEGGGVVDLPGARRGVAAILIGGLASFVAWLTAAIIPIALSSGGSPGRPLRRRGRMQTAEVTHRPEWILGAAPISAGLTSEQRALLARAWTEEAQLEHASVATFSWLSLELLALGAPPELVKETHSAAIDEVGHAQHCFALASGYAGRCVGPDAFPGALVPPSCGSDTDRRTRIVVESLIDGCFNEAEAAARADAAACFAEDPAVRQVLAKIAVDEARHAELAWRILEWALAERAAPGTLMAALPHLASPNVVTTGLVGLGRMMSAHGGSIGALRGCGVPDQQEIDDCRAWSAATVTRRALALLRTPRRSATFHLLSRAAR